MSNGGDSNARSRTGHCPLPPPTNALNQLTPLHIAQWCRVRTRTSAFIPSPAMVPVVPNRLGPTAGRDYGRRARCKQLSQSYVVYVKGAKNTQVKGPATKNKSLLKLTPT